MHLAWYPTSIYGENYFDESSFYFDTGMFSSIPLPFRETVFSSIQLPYSICQNYRPFANLFFLSKTLERLVSLELLPYLEQSGLLPARQSGFRAHHSTETALLSLLSDIYSAMDKSHVTLLAL